MSGTWTLKLNAGMDDAVKAAANKGLFLAAEHILQVSNTQVPIEEGTLERSGSTSADEGALKAAVSYDTPYAARQHEEMSWHHDQGRSAKFLESAFNSESKTAGQIIAAEIKKAT